MPEFNIETFELIHKYTLGVKKSGHPRAVYDIVKDYTVDKKKKKKKNHDKPTTSFSLFLDSKKGKKRKGKKKNKKHWHI